MRGPKTKKEVRSSRSCEKSGRYGVRQTRGEILGCKKVWRVAPSWVGVEEFLRRTAPCCDLQRLEVASGRVVSVKGHSGKRIDAPVLRDDLEAGYAPNLAKLARHDEAVR